MAMEPRVRKAQERARDRAKGWKRLSLRLPPGCEKEFHVLAAQRRAEALAREQEEALARQGLPDQ